MSARIVVLLLLLIGIHGPAIPAEFYCQVGKEVIIGLGDGVTLRTCIWEKEPGVTIRTGSLELIKNDILILKSQSNEKGKLHGEYTAWSDEGEVIETGSYVEGLKNGPWISIDKNGNNTTLVYRMGKIVAP
jgi:hypothetical protein